MCKLSVSLAPSLFVLVTFPLAARGQDRPDGDDDTLRHYLAKSEAVIVGEVTRGAQRIGVDFGPAHPVSVVSFEVKALESVKGKIAAKQTISVTVTRALGLGLSPPEQGQRLVLFLKSSGDSWVSADKWFGLTLYSPALVENLKRVKNQPPTPTEK